MLFLPRFFFADVLHIIAFLFSVNLYISISFLPAVSSTVVVCLAFHPILSSSFLSPKLNFQGYWRNMFFSISISFLNCNTACVQCSLELSIVRGVLGLLCLITVINVQVPSAMSFLNASWFPLSLIVKWELTFNQTSSLRLNDLNNIYRNLPGQSSAWFSMTGIISVTGS